MRIPITLIAATAAVLALGACGKDEPTATNTTPGATTTASSTKDTGKEACSLISVAEASEIMGQTAEVDSAPTALSGKQCVWLGKNPQLHQLQLQVFKGKAYYGPDKWTGTPETVAGLGDEAFLVRKSMLGATVGFRKGDTVVFLNYQILLSRDPDPGAKADKMIALAKQVHGRL